MPRQVTDMSEDLKKLQDAFAREAAVKPRPEAKNAALNAAMAAFEQENASAHQGSSIEARQKDQGNATGRRLVEILTFSKWRKSMKLSYLLTGGASLAVLTLAVVNSGQFRELIEPPQSATVDAVTVEKDRDDKADVRKQKTAMNIPPAPPVVLRKEEKPVAENREQTAKLAAPDAQIAASEPAPMVRAPQPAKPTARRRKMKRPVAPKKLGQLRGSGWLNAIAPPAAERELSAGLRAGAQVGDKFADVQISPLKQSEKQPVSTFSIDVDTASYSFMRSSINRNVLPPKASVRVEEMINYFPYSYPGSNDVQVPFKTSVTVLPSPWNTATKLVHIGIKGYQLPKTEKPHSNLVFLLDTSGSMNAPNKLPLLRNSFKLLLTSLSPDDMVSIVAYAGSAGVVLEPTAVKDKAKILSALDNLRAGGSTAGGEGIRLAYQLAEANFDKQGVNRVILATDGDFNVGISDRQELKGFVERKRNSGVTLSVLGFGRGNYNDALMQTLAQNGNGNAAYIDSLSEARKVLVEEAGSTLFTIAKDVKIQMEFNPAMVSEYRLIGYETRQLKREDFNNDKVDAGDIGAGHTVTAIYEITPTGSAAEMFGSLRYKKPAATNSDKAATEYGFLRLRYKLPKENKSRLIETAIKIADGLESFDDAPQDVRFSVAVAAFGQMLRGGKYLGGGFSYDYVIEMAQASKGQDPFGYRAEFINLVRLAKSAAKIQSLR
jgi:Ca-activated chloride channel family protein